MRSQVPPELRAELCFIAAGVMLVPFLWIIHPGSEVHHWFRIAWWICMAIVAIVIYRLKPWDNIIGSIFCIIFGPITLLTLLLFRLTLRWGSTHET
jgi:hypothetical protein